jgi:RimJ/RimL family protein N-acetyltransferase
LGFVNAQDGFTLREVSRGDAYVLWVWANDPLTRQAALDTHTIAWEEHRAWLAQRIGSSTARIWLAVDETDRLLGCIRFETTDDWETAKLSYTVAPDVRGRGVGRRIVETGTGRIQIEHRRVRIVADVRTANIPSIRIFRALAWDEATSRDEVIRFSRIGESE